ncbi:MAG: hypothetical protein JKX69_05735 [Rhodobacteraceae bacterium]|nr:hypothetical protein [Paracoccaceae bacterium]
MLSFIIAAIAGFLTPHLEAPVARPLAQALQSKIRLEPGELRLLAFMAAMFGAAVVLMLLGKNAGASLILGGAVGYFGPRVLAAMRGDVDTRNGG